jgi:hypothetical protein
VLDGRHVGDVQLCVGERAQLVSGQRGLEVAAELAAGAGDQDAHG